jgi:transposase InsO family protein
MTHYLQHGRNAAFTCRHFGISRQTFYRWWRRYNPQDLITLESGSHRPHRHRQPTWSTQVQKAVLTLRRQFPRWGKDKLVVLLRRQGHRISTSMVGRILSQSKRRGLLVEPLLQAVRRARRQRPPRPYAIRKPKDYQPSRPGDLVEVDTVDLRLVPGSILKQFTARDVISRWDVCEVHRRATSTAASLFLKTLLTRSPFPIRAIQVDGGSEFQALFEQACQHYGLRLFVLPPRSPKLNGAVERANRTHTEEFYEVTPCSLQIAALNRELQNWELIYNTVRPHQALGYLTPAEFLVSLNQSPQKCH